MTFPITFETRETVPLEGKSLLPIFEGVEREFHEALFWEQEGSGAVRQGSLKLVRAEPNAPWELYDPSTDRPELVDLAHERPETVAEMERLWTAWTERVHVYPKRNGD